MSKGQAGSQKKEVLFITGVFPAPSETFIQRQISGVVNAGYPVTVIALSQGSHKSTENNSLPPGLKLFRGKAPRGRFKRALRALYLILSLNFVALNIIRISFKHQGIQALRSLPNTLEIADIWKNLSSSLQPDIIHAQFGTLGIAVAPLIKTSMISGELVVAYRGSDITSYAPNDNLLRQCYSLLFQVAKKHLPVSSNLQRKLIDLGCEPENIVIVPSPIDLPNSLPNRPVKALAKEINLISVGRFVEKKGFELGIEALDGLQTTYPDTTFNYHLVGDGPLADQLRQATRAKGLSKNVYFHGWLPQSEVLQKVIQSDFLIVPSRTAANGDQEGIPNVIKEAFMLGTLVVASRHGGIPDLVHHLHTGFLFKENDSSDLLKTLKRAILTSNSWPAIRRAAFNSARDNYSVPSNVEQLQGLYEIL